MKTDRLIERLAQDLQPAPALRGPWVRAGWWLLGAVAYLAVLTIMLTSREDLAANGMGWRFLLPQAAALFTAAVSAAAAFASTMPGFSRRILLLPAAAVMVWLGTLVGGAVQEWSHAGAATPTAQREWLCVVTMVLAGALPGWGIAAMLRKGAPLTPRLTVALGMLAVAALVNVAACISHPHTSHAVTLVWHGSTIFALVAMGVCSSHLLLTWAQRQQVARGQA
jgi:hypothetical protein